MKSTTDARFYSALGRVTLPAIARTVAERTDSSESERPCVMQCGRPASGMRVDERELCAHCFIVTVEIVAHELGQMIRSAVSR